LLHSVIESHGLFAHRTVNELVPPATINTISFIQVEKQLK
jgi:hypothetical protein